MIRGAFFSTSCASVRRESADRATRDSPRFPSVPRAHPRDAPARSGQRAIRGGFLQPLARVRETRQRGVGNARFAAAFFYLSRASARRESAEWATRDSRRLSSTPRARPRDAPARSGQHAIRGGFLQPLVRIRETRQLTTICRQFAALQPLAHIRETRQRGVGNARIAAAFFNPSRASARRESTEWATRDSRRLSSTPRARPRDAPARSGQHAIRGGFLQHFAHVCETRKRGTGSA